MKKILIALAVFFLLVLIITALLSVFSGGGEGNGTDTATTTQTQRQSLNPFAGFLSTSTDGGQQFFVFEQIELPGGPTQADQGAGGDGLPAIESADGLDTQAIERELLDIEDEYDDLRGQLDEAKVFGDPSPHREQVSLSSSFGGARADRPSTEYLSLTASSLNTTPVDITGWSLQSLVTGVRVSIPQGVRVFESTQANTVDRIYLDPGAEAIVTTGPSPVGVSFRENICSGYLGQFQSFVPSLPQQCPAPSEELPSTLENLRTYGEQCIDFVRNLPRCSFYLDELPGSLSPACELFVKNALTYQGCVDAHRWRPSFIVGDWRIYLNQSRELWQNSRDVIRLLDAQGRTVDVWTY